MQILRDWPDSEWIGESSDQTGGDEDFFFSFFLFI